MTTDQAIHELIRKGAALGLPGNPTLAMPVAWWRRISPTRHFYHAAGYSDFDGHAFDCAREVVLYDGYAVSFLDKAGKITAYLTQIDELETDPVAAEHLAAQIREWKAYYDAHDFFRAGVLGNYQRNGTGQ